MSHSFLFLSKFNSYHQLNAPGNCEPGCFLDYKNETLALF
nr:MAG TPA: hypothetical protein [Caudoviricetes sp.]